MFFYRKFTRTCLGRDIHGYRRVVFVLKLLGDGRNIEPHSQNVVDISIFWRGWSEQSHTGSSEGIFSIITQSGHRIENRLTAS